MYRQRADHIRYASEEDRRKAEALAASIDAAEAEMEREGTVSPEVIAEMLRERLQLWARRDDANRQTR